MANALFKEEWYRIIKDSDMGEYEEDRNRIAWAVLEYVMSGDDYELNDVRKCYDRTIEELVDKVRKEIENRRLRAEAARKRRQERKQSEVNRPRRSHQRIYETHPAMYLFDGYASFMMSTEYNGGRKAFADKLGRAIDFDKAIVRFRKYAIENKLLSSMQRFNVFRDMLIRFIKENLRVLTVKQSVPAAVLS